MNKLRIGPAWAGRLIFLMALLLTTATGSAEELEAWTAAIAGDSVRWTSTISPPQYMSGSETEADERLLPLLDRSLPVPVKFLRLTTPELRATDKGGEVWSMSASENASKYIVGSRRRGEAWQPLYFCATGLSARSDPLFKEALARMLSVVLHNDAASVQVSGLPHLAEDGQTRLETWGKGEIKAPWDAYWVFMVDDAPLANWAHPCRYVFVSPDLSTIAVLYASTPLTARPLFTPETQKSKNLLETIIPFVPDPESPKQEVPEAFPQSGLMRYDGHVSNCYAVIISGGGNLENNHIRYWGDASFIYSTLTLKYGYPKTNVHALISDGLDPAPDRSDNTNSPTDLDGDGIPDTRASATKANISHVFAALQAQLQPTDQLFVFLTDHGGPTTGGGEWDVDLVLWNNELLTDYEMAALTEPIACPVFFAMEQCYSGGFLDNLNQMNRAIATAAQFDESSFSGDTHPYFNQWAYHFTAALRGFYPDNKKPWIDTKSCNADFNEDFHVSFEEAYQFAMIHKYPEDHPMYNENPSGSGKRLFLNMPDPTDLGVGELVFDSIPDRLFQFVNRPFPVRITAQNVFGHIITDYSGPAGLQAKAKPIDTGRYVGTGTKYWAYPFITYYMDARTQVIYPPDLLGGACTIDRLALEIINPPSLPLNNWTIRMKHTSLTAYPENPVWETEGWTVVYAANQTISDTGWVYFEFTRPFEYDGESHLMVDFSFYNESFDNKIGLCHATKSTAVVAISYASDNEYGDPLLWSKEGPLPDKDRYFPNLRLGPPPVPVVVKVAPANPAGFTEGVWTGLVTALDPAAEVRLWASDADHPWQGGSNWFSVTEPILAR